MIDTCSYFVSTAFYSCFLNESVFLEMTANIHAVLSISTYTFVVLLFISYDYGYQIVYV